MRFLIGVDIGTQGSKGALISEAGQILASSSIEQDLSTPHPGWAEHDADRSTSQGTTVLLAIMVHIRAAS